MNLISCLNPKVIRNKYTGELMTVPCGHCASCQNKRGDNWVRRITTEMSCWPFAVFFTLTYL